LQESNSMKINLKRILRKFRNMLATGAVAALALFGSESSSRAALVISNGSFETPSAGGSYNYYSVGFAWNSHNLGPDYYGSHNGRGGDHGTGNNGNLVQNAESYITTGGMSTGSQYAAAVLWDTPANVFSGTTGSSPTGMYVDQTIGTINTSDSGAQYTLSADLIRIVDAIGDNYGGRPPTVAGAGITIGFLNANTGAIIAQTPISYTTSYAAGNSTPVKITSSISWSPSSSSLPIGTPINAFIGFRLDPNYSNHLNGVAVDNVVLTNSLTTMKWKGTDPSSPTQWSTNPSVLNWSSGAYSDGSYVTFDDSVGFGSTVVDVSGADVFPSNVVFNNANVNYTLQGSNGIAGSATLNVAGGGAVTVNNSNSFTGATTLTGGTLVLGNAAGLTNSTVILNTDDLLAFATGITAPTIGGLSGPGFLGLSDAVGNPVSLTVGGNNATTTYSGGMYDVGSLTKVGSGTLVLTGPSNYAGTTTISSGTLQISSGDYIVSTLGLGAVTNNATLVLSSSDRTVPVASAISGSGSVVQMGPAMASIGQPNVNVSSLPSGNTSTPYQTSYSAGNTGVVTGNSAWAPVILPAAGSGQPVGALFMVRSYSTSGAAVERANTDLHVSELDYGGPGVTAFFRWNGGIWNYIGLGILEGNNQSAASNTYTGATIVSGGTLALLTTDALSPASPVSVAAGATLDLGVGSQTIVSIAGAGTVNTVSFNLSVGGDDSSQTFSGVIKGAGGLIKTGTGSLRLTGTDSYTGGTWVNGGKLIIVGTAAIASGSNLYIGDPTKLGLLPDAVVPDPAVAVPAASQSAAAAAVPEPGSLAMLGAAAIVAMNRKRIKKRV
jgi:autotransporter-associated beta strand protein